MGKKRHRKSYISKGQRPNISRKHIFASDDAIIFNKLEAWKNGKRGYITVANPNKQETNKRFIKVTYEQFFGGTYKDVKARIRPASSDNDKVELAL